MAADAFSATLGWLQMGTGNDNNSWGTNHNSQVSQIFENSIAGMLSESVTGGTLDLSGSPPPAAASQVAYGIINFSGVLTSNETVKVPNLSNRWIIFNNTSGAFQLTMQTPTPGTTVLIPQGTAQHIWCDGSQNLRRLSRPGVGEIFAFGGTVAPAGSVACDGTTYSRTVFAELYAAISTTWGVGDGVTTFAVPSLQDTGRFLRSKSGSLTVGTTQASVFKTHTHAITSTDAGHTHAVSDAGHTHAITDPGHFHNVKATSSLFGAGTFTAVGTPLGSGTSAQGNTDSKTTGITINSGTTGITVNSGTASITSTAVATGDATETRPESAVVLYCIRI